MSVDVSYIMNNDTPLRRAISTQYFKHGHNLFSKEAKTIYPKHMLAAYGAIRLMTVLDRVGAIR